MCLRDELEAIFTFTEGTGNGRSCRWLVVWNSRMGGGSGGTEETLLPVAPDCGHREHEAHHAW